MASVSNMGTTPSKQVLTSLLLNLSNLVISWIMLPLALPLHTFMTDVLWCKKSVFHPCAAGSCSLTTKALTLMSAMPWSHVDTCFVPIVVIWSEKKVWFGITMALFAKHFTHGFWLFVEGGWVLFFILMTQCTNLLTGWSHGETPCWFWYRSRIGWV